MLTPDGTGDRRRSIRKTVTSISVFPSFIIQRKWKITVAAVLGHARSHLSVWGEKLGGLALPFLCKSPIVRQYRCKQWYLQTGILSQLLHLLQPSCLLQLQKHNESDHHLYTTLTSNLKLCSYMLALIY